MFEVQRKQKDWRAKKVRNQELSFIETESNFRKKGVIPKASCCKVVRTDEAIYFGNQEVTGENSFRKG